MTRNNGKILNILFGLGLIFFLGGIVLFSIGTVEHIEMVDFVLHLVFLLITAAFVYFSVILSRPAVFYISFNLCVACLFTMILSVRGISLDAARFWPVILCSCGITLLPVGRIKFRRFRTIYVFPSIVLTVIGIIFLLFSWKIIKVPLRVFVSYSMPIIFTFLGIVLIALYYIKNSTKEKFPYVPDEEDDDDPDELFTNPSPDGECD